MLSRATWGRLAGDGPEGRFSFELSPVKKYIVRLTPEEQTSLLQMIRRGKAAARTRLPARILLKADSSPEASGLERRSDP
jgi:hypothetical protein